MAVRAVAAPRATGAETGCPAGDAAAFEPDGEAAERAGRAAALPIANRRSGGFGAAVYGDFAGAVSDTVDGGAFFEFFQAAFVQEAMDFDFVAAAPAVGWSSSARESPAVVGQQEQPFGIEVEPSDGDDARQAGGKVRKNGVAPFFVFVRGNEPRRVCDTARGGFCPWI